MVEFNDNAADSPDWPRGETWCLGDQPSIGVLLQDREHITYTMQPAPQADVDCRYSFPGYAHKIRVYDSVNVRLTLEDFYAKLALYFSPGLRR